MEQHAGENAQPEVNVVSLVLWLEKTSPLFYCSATCRANTTFLWSSVNNIMQFIISSFERKFLTLWPDATARSSPWAWKAIEAIGRSAREKVQTLVKLYCLQLL